MKPSKLHPLILAAATVILAGHANGATIIGNLQGLLTPTGAATNGNRDRQYSHNFVGTGDASGATVTLVYTLGTSNGNLSNAFNFDDIFRYAPGNNLQEGQSLTLTIDSISVNSGWTLNSVAKTDSVLVTSVNGSTTRFSVNGGATFDFTPTTGSTTSNANRTFTNSAFTAFDSPGDTLTMTNQVLNGGFGQNLREVAFSFDVIPEPSSALLGGIGLLVLLRRRR